MSKEQPLTEQLRDIHQPETSISLLDYIQAWWIPVVLLVAVILVIMFYQRHRKKMRPRVYALNELEQMRTRYQEHKEDQRLLNEVNMLLRRMAVLYYDRDEVAPLSGEKWLQFLDKSGKTRDFSAGPGQILSKTYDASLPEFDESALTDTVRNWIMHQV